MDIPIEDGDFPQFFVCLPEGTTKAMTGNDCKGKCLRLPVTESTTAPSVLCHHVFVSNRRKVADLHTGGWGKGVAQTSLVVENAG